MSALRLDAQGSSDIWRRGVNTRRELVTSIGAVGVAIPGNEAGRGLDRWMLPARRVMYVSRFDVVIDASRDGGKQDS